MESNKQMLASTGQMIWFAGGLGIAGFLALAVTGWLQWRAAARMSLFAPPPGFPALLPPGHNAPLSIGQQRGQAANSRLMDALVRLEHRIAELDGGHHESTSANTLPAIETTGGTMDESAAMTPGSATSQELALLLSLIHI